MFTLSITRFTLYRLHTTFTPMRYRQTNIKCVVIQRRRRIWAHLQLNKLVGVFFFRQILYDTIDWTMAKFKTNYIRSSPSKLSPIDNLPISWAQNSFSWAFFPLIIITIISDCGCCCCCYIRNWFITAFRRIGWFIIGNIGQYGIRLFISECCWWWRFKFTFFQNRINLIKLPFITFSNHHRFNIRRNFVCYQRHVQIIYE